MQYINMKHETTVDMHLQFHKVLKHLKYQQSEIRMLIIGPQVSKVAEVCYINFRTHGKVPENCM